METRATRDLNQEKVRIRLTREDQRYMVVLIRLEGSESSECT